jgi:hypothetical protein
VGDWDVFAVHCFFAAVSDPAEAATDGGVATGGTAPAAGLHVYDDAAGAAAADAGPAADVSPTASSSCSSTGCGVLRRAGPFLHAVRPQV